MVNKTISAQEVPSYAEQPPPGMFHLSRGSYNSYHGQGRGRCGGSARPQYQICGKFGHLAQRCFYRYDSVSDGEGENHGMRDDSECSSWVGYASHVGQKPIIAYMCCADGGSH
ncbi:hypothetical protein PVK06_011927 [Gossypium arboreum]|uniref:CCHC-type domain-containing protein n=1 Tax=Gossypium arboreum TaxID=29729 RepID=A0ABR0QA86_GOSAR|nr:hypothetical protein PVK06_011927 [Gossypium arboreum]